MIQETVPRVKQSDLVKGEWCTTGQEMDLWVDARSLAMGVSLEDDRAVIEEACWLHLENNSQHINLAKLDTVLKGINLALQWQAKVLHLKTDSLCTYHWLKNSLTGKAKVHTKVAAEILIRRRLQTLLQLIEGYGLTSVLTLVRSEQNRANELTRVPQKWFKAMKQGRGMSLDVCAVALKYWTFIAGTLW